MLAPWFPKVNVPNSVIYLNWRPLFEWMWLSKAPRKNIKIKIIVNIVLVGWWGGKYEFLMSM